MDPAQDDAGQGAEPTGPLGRSAAVAISVGALIVAGVHLIWPDLQIDAVTLALVAVAALPWLAPIFKSVELPGGWKFEYQQVQAEVREVRRRVEDVERLVFSGDTTPQVEHKLSSAVREFAGYLGAIHDALSVPPPSVHLEQGLENAQYDSQANQIQLDPQFAADQYSVLREYAHHVLGIANPTFVWRDRSALTDVESGLADYLVASHTGAAGLGPELARWFRQRYGHDKPYVRDLQNDRRFDTLSAHDPSQSAGEIWGGAFWELRKLLGQPDADRLLATVWIQADWESGNEEPEDRLSPTFPTALLGALGGRQLAEVRRIFEARGLSL